MPENSSYNITGVSPDASFTPRSCLVVKKCKPTTHDAVGVQASINITVEARCRVECSSFNHRVLFYELDNDKGHALWHFRFCERGAKAST